MTQQQINTQILAMGFLEQIRNNHIDAARFRASLATLPERERKAVEKETEKLIMGVKQQ